MCSPSGDIRGQACRAPLLRASIWVTRTVVV
jgi:hypothetical protein